MFSFAGDTVLDPFLGTGTTTVAAARWGRNSIGYEVDPEYMELARSRISRGLDGLFSTAEIVYPEANKRFETVNSAVADAPSSDVTSAFPKSLLYQLETGKPSFS